MIAHHPKSIRTFIGAQNFALSRSFYQELGFIERVISSDMSYFQIGSVGFYLQDYYVKDWVDNSMIFLEVDDVEKYWRELKALELTKKYESVNLTPIKEYEWGRECFLHDPSGVLWHFGEFYEN